MEYNERNITAVEVFKKLKEVEKQNKEKDIVKVSKMCATF